MKDYLTTEEVAAETGISEPTLRFWVHKGKGPKSFKLGRRRLYLRSDLDAWVKARYEETVRGDDA